MVNQHQIEGLPPPAGDGSQHVEPEWLPMLCSEHGCEAVVQCHDCERCMVHCRHQQQGRALGLSGFLGAEEIRRERFQQQIRTIREKRSRRV